MRPCRSGPAGDLCSALPGDECERCVGRHRVAVEEALRLFASLFDESGGLCGILDAFGRDRQAEAVTEAQQRPKESRCIRIFADTAQEAAIDLDFIDLEVAQVII